jgi:hypothetical protein
MEDRGPYINSWEWSTGESIDSVTLFEREVGWSTRASGFSMFETGESQSLVSNLEKGPVWDAPGYILQQLNEEIEKMNTRKKKEKPADGK